MLSQQAEDAGSQHWGNVGAGRASRCSSSASMSGKRPSRQNKLCNLQPHQRLSSPSTSVNNEQPSSLSFAQEDASDLPVISAIECLPCAKLSILTPLRTSPASGHHVCKSFAYVSQILRDDHQQLSGPELVKIAFKMCGCPLSLCMILPVCILLAFLQPECWM